MEGKTMTVADVLKVTVEMLSGVMVPAGLSEQIGVPIQHSIRNLQECVRAIEMAETAKEIENDG